MSNPEITIALVAAFRENVQANIEAVLAKRPSNIPHRMATESDRFETYECADLIDKQDVQSLFEVDSLPCRAPAMAMYRAMMQLVSRTPAGLILVTGLPAVTVLSPSDRQTNGLLGGDPEAYVTIVKMEFGMQTEAPVNA